MNVKPPQKNHKCNLPIYKRFCPKAREPSIFTSLSLQALKTTANTDMKDSNN